MKVNCNRNTLRGIFFCLQGNNFSPCPRTVFRQTLKTRNVCLKRRFPFVERKNYKLNTRTLLPGKSSPIFSHRFASQAGLVSLHKIITGLAPLRFKKTNTFLSVLIFAGGAKMYKQSFRFGLLRAKW
jgi:hypothetical protein